jgi:hypothetical protein
LVHKHNVEAQRAVPAFIKGLQDGVIREAIEALKQIDPDALIAASRPSSEKYPR